MSSKESIFLYLNELHSVDPMVWLALIVIVVVSCLGLWLAYKIVAADALCREARLALEDVKYTKHLVLIEREYVKKVALGLGVDVSKAHEKHREPAVGLKG